MSPTGGVEALADLLPMHILLKRLVEHHPIRTVLELSMAGLAPTVPLGLGSLSLAIKCRLLSPAKDTVAGCVEFTETFQVLHPEVEPGSRVVDLFPDHII